MKFLDSIGLQKVVSELKLLFITRSAADDKFLPKNSTYDLKMGSNLNLNAPAGASEWNHINCFNNQKDIVGVISVTDSGLIRLRANDGVVVTNIGDNVYMPISASAFNVNSSLRYKENVLPIPLEKSSGILSIDVSSYNYKSDTADENGNKPINIGVIAEQCHVNGLTECIDYNNEGEPNEIGRAHV